MNRIRVIANLAVIVIGIAMMLWPVTVGAQQTFDCRGVTMRPGDVCHKMEVTGQQGNKTQSYEQRRQAWQDSSWVLVGVGFAVTGFGVVLVAPQLRRKNTTHIPNRTT